MAPHHQSTTLPVAGEWLTPPSRSEEVPHPHRDKVKDFESACNSNSKPNPWLTGSLVEGLLEGGQPATLVGPEKSCKTTLTADLVAAAMTGTPFLGFPIPQPFKVAVLSFEGSIRHFQDLVSRSLTRRGADPERAYSGYVCANLRELLLGKEKRWEFNSYLRNAWVRLVVVDPLYLVLPTRATSSVFAVGSALRRLVEPIVAETAAAPLIVHHTRELPVGQVPGLSDLSGAGLAAFVKGWLLLNRAEVYAGGGVHRLVAVAGTSEGAFKSMSIEVRESDMAVEVGRPAGSPAAGRKERTGGPAFLRTGRS